LFAAMAWPPLRGRFVAAGGGLGDTCLAKDRGGACVPGFGHPIQEKIMKSRPAFRFSSLLLCGLLGAGVAGSAAAQSASGAQGLLNDRWVFDLGMFVFNSSLKASLNGQSTNNPQVDFDDTFGKARDATRVRGDVLWRITPEHHMRLMYFDNQNTRTKVLEENIAWGDYTFLSGSSAKLKQQMQTFELSYEYAFMRSPTYEVAASIGVHYSKFKIQLSGTADYAGPDCGEPPCNAQSSKTNNSLSAPLPVIGLRAGWVVAQDWYVDAQGQFFKAKAGAYDGNWSDLRVGATWMFNRNYGVGLGYNRFMTRVDVSKNDFDGRLNTGYSGLQAYLTGTF
jgi:hypothetical protein